MLDFLENSGYKYIIALTKADKLKPTELAKRREAKRRPITRPGRNCAQIEKKRGIGKRHSGHHRRGLRGRAFQSLPAAIR